MLGRGVVLFHTTSTCLRAEKALKAAGIECKLVPTPRELSSDCGIAVQFSWLDLEALERCLSAHGVEVEAVGKLA